jgi:hypothetical protein
VTVIHSIASAQFRVATLHRIVLELLVFLVGPSVNRGASLDRRLSWIGRRTKVIWRGARQVKCKATLRSFQQPLNFMVSEAFASQRFFVSQMDRPLLCLLSCEGG